MRGNLARFRASLEKEGDTWPSLGQLLASYCSWGKVGDVARCKDMESFLTIHSIHRAQQAKIPVMAIVGEEVIKKVLPFIPYITLQVQTLRIPSAEF